MKFFSFCLFDGSKDPDNLPFNMYLNGFLQNCEVIKYHFPDFKIVLYVDQEIKKTIEQNYYINTNPLIKINFFDNDTGIQNAAVYYRYNILTEPFEIAIIRDIDQVLTELDIVTLKNWINDHNSNYLFYLYKSSHCKNNSFDGICGGGFATKNNHITALVNSDETTKHILDTIVFLKKSNSFNLDEQMIWLWLRKLEIIIYNDGQLSINSNDVTYLTLERTDKVRHPKRFQLIDSDQIMFDLPTL
jgi:hypothetical protein